MDFEFVLRWAENVQNWACWAFSHGFWVGMIFWESFQLLYTPCRVNLSSQWPQLTSWLLGQPVSVTSVYALPNQLPSLSSHADMHL